MASFLPVSSAARTQSTTMLLRLNTCSSIASTRTTCSSFSTLCSPSRLTRSRKLPCNSDSILYNPSLLDEGQPKKKKKKKKEGKQEIFELTHAPHLESLVQLFTHSNNTHSIFPTQQSRSFLVQLRRQTQAQIPKESSPTPSPAAANLQLTNLPYFIRRTPSNQLPVYLVTKAGGTKQQTKIQKTEGDMDALRSDLALYLGFESGDPRAPSSPDVSINRLNGHITVKVGSGGPRTQLSSYMRKGITLY